MNMDSTDPELSSMTVTEIARWLEAKGIPVEYCLKFEGEFDCWLETCIQLAYESRIA